MTNDKSRGKSRRSTGKPREKPRGAEETILEENEFRRRLAEAIPILEGYLDAGPRVDVRLEAFELMAKYGFGTTENVAELEEDLARLQRMARP